MIQGAVWFVACVALIIMRSLLLMPQHAALRCSTPDRSRGAVSALTPRDSDALINLCAS
jgi:hypothetical protein